MSRTTDILRDTFGREHTYLRISLTEKCNLRCTYCMPEEGVVLSPRSQLMTASEVVEIAKVFVENGVDKIRLTGGEPLLRKDFAEILHPLSQLPTTLTLTTNAILVDRYIEDLKKAGVQSLNVSLDTLKPEKFFTITKRDQFHKAYGNARSLLQEGFGVKLNVVLIKGFNDDEIIDFIQLTEHQNLHVRFIEFMPFDGNRWDKSKLVTQQEILTKTENYFGVDQLQILQNKANFIARNYQINGFIGRFGIISTVSNPFCDGCNRIRLTANGSIKNCLFSMSETNLLEPFRNDEPIEPIIKAVLLKKKAVRAGMDDARSFESPTNHSKNRSMITIGG